MRHLNPRRKTIERWEPKPEWFGLAQRRCKGFVEAAITAGEIGEGHNPIHVLVASCYLQGAADMCDTMDRKARIEGQYEEER